MAHFPPILLSLPSRRKASVQALVTHAERVHFGCAFEVLSWPAPPGRLGVPGLTADVLATWRVAVWGCSLSNGRLMACTASPRDHNCKCLRTMEHVSSVSSLPCFALRCCTAALQAAVGEVTSV